MDRYVRGITLLSQICGVFAAALIAASVIGTLLDNNIVVQENLHRHLEMGKDGYSAAEEESAIELTLPIFVATICILIVYLPIIFFSGIIKFLLCRWP